MDQKISTGLGTAIIIIVSATVVYFAWKTTEVLQIESPPVLQNSSVPTQREVVAERLQEEPMEWQTYRNEEYGYEIQYPGSYALFQSIDKKAGKTIPADAKSKQIIITEKPEMFFCCEPTYLEIRIFEEPQVDYSTWADRRQIVISDNAYRVTKRGPVTFAGEPAYEIKADCGIDSPKNHVLVYHASKMFFIEYDSESCFPQVEKIVSSFKFIR